MKVDKIEADIRKGWRGNLECEEQGKEKRRKEREECE